jgi:hypothetical protein
LPPIEKMAGIIFENENIIDLGIVPDTTCKTEKKKEKVCEKITCIDLRAVSTARLSDICTDL